MTIEVRGRRIGAGQPCFVIAEAGVNHNGDLDLAMQLVDAAAAAGADAVKFQTFRTEQLMTSSAPKAAYQERATGTEGTQSDMIRALELSEDAHRTLLARCEERGIVFLSTPFDEASADLLTELGVPLFKTGSGELTSLSLLRHIARKKRPMIVSTGMANIGEVEAALGAIHAEGNRDVAVLHCVSSYPAPTEDVNLRAMDTMRRAFDVPVGYSDHTLGAEIAIAAVALGACIIEKHLTMSCALPGPDHQASMEPAELTAMVSALRRVEAALGDGRKRPRACEENTAAVARRSLVSRVSIPAGAEVTDAMLVLKRPGTGVPPSAARWIVGRTARVDIAADTLLDVEMFR